MQGSTQPGAARRLPRSILNWFVTRGDYVAVLMVYVLITIAFTWPLAANFATFVNGNVWDVFHELWYLNYDFHAPLGPFFNMYTSSILYPIGVPLYYQVFSPLHAIIGAPLYRAFGLIPAYNFLYMFTFFVSAFTMYILVKYLTGNRYAAFFAGMAFAFAPVHAGQGTAHLNIMASELLPLFTYFFIRMQREAREREAIYAGVVLALNAMLDLHFLMLSGFIIVAYLVYSVLFQRGVFSRRYLLRLVIMAAVAAFIGAAAYYQTLYGLVFAPQQYGLATASNIPVNLIKATDLYQFFLPAPENPILGRLAAPLYANVVTLPQIRTYIGFTALSVALFGLAINRKKREILFWGFLALVGFAFALGPVIEVAGKSTGLQGIWSYAYDLIPIFRVFRTPYRLDYLVALGVAVLGGYGIAGLLPRLEKRVKGVQGARLVKVGTVIVLSSLLFVEFVPAPYQELNVSIPSFYTQVLANDHTNFAVLEVPAYVTDKVYMYYQMAYNKPLVNGYVSRTPTSSLLFLQGYPFIQQLGFFLGTKHPPTEVLNQTIVPAVIGPYILAQYHIKYIILHRDLMTPALYNESYNLVASVAGLPYYQDSLLTVFKFTPPTPNFGLQDYPATQNSSTLSLLFGGWNPYGLIIKGGRTMDVSAGVQVFSASTQYVQFRFRAEGVNQAYLFRVSVDNQTVGTFLAQGNSYNVYNTPLVQLHPGLNTVVFTSGSGCQQVSAQKKGVSAVIPRSACASLQFSWIATVQPTTTG